MTAVESSSEWEPGDPIYQRAPYRDYIFNFRDDSADDPYWENRGDAARWPTPSNTRTIAEDPLASWLREYRAWAAVQPQEPDDT